MICPPQYLLRSLKLPNRLWILKLNWALSDWYRYTLIQTFEVFIKEKPLDMSSSIFDVGTYDICTYYYNFFSKAASDWDMKNIITQVELKKSKANRRVNRHWHEGKQIRANTNNIYKTTRVEL